MIAFVTLVLTVSQHMLALCGLQLTETPKWCTKLQYSIVQASVCVCSQGWNSVTVGLISSKFVTLLCEILKTQI